ncbi:hypothetical protein R1sor_015716 [Riccia sorocarpa]|uniref:FCP1 homology domain-containing protein n=1 Tax=Riccia sorocarpa TaxID=122646 RepID=A0ABD3HFP8_9MARC
MFLIPDFELLLSIPSYAKWGVLITPLNMFETAREQQKDGFLRCKSVHVLYDFGICTKDVIIIDDTVQKNSPNHPFQAVHPHPFDPFKTAKKDENYLNMVLQPFLDKFRGHKGDGISYVQANWQAAQAQDPIASLVGYWAPMDERDEDFLWSNCTAADCQKFLAKMNGHRLKLSTQKAMQFAIADAAAESLPSLALPAKAEQQQVLAQQEKQEQTFL